MKKNLNRPSAPCQNAACSACLRSLAGVLCCLGLVWISLAATTVSAQSFASPTGSYSVKESWTFTVTDAYTGALIKKLKGVATGSVAVKKGVYALIDKTGLNAHLSGTGNISHFGNIYKSTSETVLYGFVAQRGGGFSVITRLSYFTILVPLGQPSTSGGFSRDDDYVSKGSSPSKMIGSAVATGDQRIYKITSSSSINIPPF